MLRYAISNGAPTMVAKKSIVNRSCIAVSVLKPSQDVSRRLVSYIVT